MEAPVADIRERAQAASSARTFPLQGAVAIFGRDMLVLSRSLFWELLAVIAYPITLYLSFGFGLSGYIREVEGLPYTLFIAPGLISMTAVNAAFDEASWSMWFHRRVQKTIDEYRVNPITVYDIVIGKILSGFAQGAIKGVAVAVVIFLMTPARVRPLEVLGYLLYIFIGSMIFSCLGTVCGSLVEKPANIGRLQSVVLIPLMFLSGIFFPISAFPSSVLPYVKLLPTTAVFEGARQALVYGRIESAYLLNLLVTAPVVFFVAVTVFNRKMAE